MNKRNYLLAAGLILALMTNSCKKDNPGGGTANGIGFTATTEQDGGNSKTHLDGLNVLWTAYDQIKVATQAAPSTAYTFELTSGENKQNGTFYTGEPHPSVDFFDENNQDYIAVYPATSGITSATQVTFTLPSTQTRHATQYFADNTNPMVAVSSNRTLPFKNVCGGLGFQLTGIERVKSLRLTSKNTSVHLCGTYTVTLDANGTPISYSVTGGSNAVVLNCDVVLSSTPQWFYFMLPVVNMSSGFTLEAFDGENCTGNVLYKHDGPAVTIERSKIIKAQNAAYAKIGAIHAPFSVSASKKVYFSKGNLQYIGSAATPYWKFADNQWTKLTTNDSAASNVDRDLFGWGTSGYPGNTYYQPYATAYVDDTRTSYGPVGEIDLTGSNFDWGVYNAISNGGGTAGQWYTLSIAEWTYVLSQRNASTINGVDDARLVNATVNGVYGMVLFPDNFVYPSDVTLPVAVNINVKVNSYVTVYNAADWAKMEAAGAVFLPAAGWRYGITIANSNYGYYWSASCYGDGWAQGPTFGPPSDPYPGCSGGRFYGQSVRLVHDLP